MLDHLAVLRSGRSRRQSSWDRTGGNRDAWPIAPGETKELARMDGAGIVRHLWFTVACEDEWYLRKLVLRMYWDGQAQPSVEAPVGDFFGVGHGKVASYQSVALNMSAQEGQDQRAAMNCYFPMPYGQGARITVQNEGGAPVRSFYFYIDYDELAAPPDDMGRFHAQWRRANPCPQPVHGGDDPTVNLSDRDNYLILETEGRGHYVGCNLSVHNLYGGWWGEGDDMIMLDGQKWPPDLHGTGSEDYFTHAWGMQVQNAFLYAGVSYNSPGIGPGFNQRITVYRYHIADPIIFQRSIRVSIEHGHANDRSDDYSSTAYWYQMLPAPAFPPLPPAAGRVPRPDAIVQPTDLPIPPSGYRRSGSPIEPQAG